MTKRKTKELIEEAVETPSVQTPETPAAVRIPAKIWSKQPPAEVLLHETVASFFRAMEEREKKLLHELDVCRRTMSSMAKHINDFYQVGGLPEKGFSIKSHPDGSTRLMVPMPDKLVNSPE